MDGGERERGKDKRKTKTFHRIPCTQLPVELGRNASRSNGCRENPALALNFGHNSHRQSSSCVVPLGTGISGEVDDRSLQAVGPQAGCLKGRSAQSLSAQSQGLAS